MSIPIIMLTHFRKWRERLLVYLTHRIALPVITFLHRPAPFPYTHHELLQLQEGSTGRALVGLLDQYRLHLLPYYEKHDIKHLLLGYPPTEEGEVCLQSFMLGNRHYSFPVLASVIFGLLTMPEYHRAMKLAWQRGRNTPSLNSTDWFALIPRPLDVAREQMQIAPQTIKT